jgi:parvulin-like peptidyl-prolyl isomerase
MSVIQTIRDKYATLMVVTVCVSLVAFLLMDALVGPKSFFHQSTDVGVVNGEALDYRDFTNQVESAMNMYRASHPDAPVDDNTRHQIREQIWTKFVQDQLLGAEYDQLGIGFSADELRDLTVTMDADPQIQSIQAFQDPKTGRFEPTRVAAYEQSLRNAPADNPQAQQQRAQWMQLLEYLQTSSMARKFSSLITQAIYVPSWLAREKEQEKNSYADISYVSASYTSVPDSAVRITDRELQDYLDAHSALFQQQASRSVEYVSFAAIPTAKDTAAIMKQINSLKAQMDTLPASDIPAFITRNSETKFYDGYMPASMIQSSKKDSLLSLPEGGQLGPYFDNGMVTYAKMLGKKTIPDTVKVQQLLLSTQAAPDSTAERRIDSIEGAIRGGASFAAMVDAFSDGPKDNGGEITLTPGNPNIPAAFNDFAFNHSKGDMGIVKTEYGYHLVRITEQKNFEPAYKIAYLTRHLDPSQETDNATFTAASQFAGTNRTKAAFEKASNGQNGITRHVADDIKPDDYDVQGIGPARDLIKWAFQAKKGDVSDVFSLGNQYVIAVLTGIREKGTAPLQDVKPQVEALVRRHKKAVMIAAKMKGTTLEQIAKSVNDSVSQARHIGFATPFIPDAGFEPKVVGAAFNPALKNGKLSSAVYGNNGVYMLKVDSLQRQAADSSQISQFATQQEMVLRQQVGQQIMDVLKKDADIEDNRLKFF